MAIEPPTQGPNPFQMRALEKVRQVAAASNATEAESFRSDRDDYDEFFKGTIQAGDNRVEIFLYNDEAAFESPKTHWRIFETPDYRTSDELIEAFAAALGEELRRA